MKKKTILLTSLLISLLLLTACGAAALPEGFDEAATLSAAENAVAVLNAGDYEGFNALCAENVRDRLTPEVMEGAVGPVLAEAGEFAEFRSSAMSSRMDDSGADYVAVVLSAKYENQTVTYTVSLNRDLMVMGFFLK